MKNIFRIIIIFIIILLNLKTINNAKTNNIHEINITINIQKDGSAKITEIWKADIYSRNRTISFF